ncbi:MAG: hypothetical protein QOD38_2007, partial [Acidimicrobiaceae bacterium]
MKHRLKIIAGGVAIAAGLAIGPAFAATTVPGQTGGRTDKDGNGFPDAGVQVVGNYTDTYVDGATSCSL